MFKFFFFFFFFFFYIYTFLFCFLATITIYNRQQQIFMIWVEPNQKQFSPLRRSEQNEMDRKSAFNVLLTTIPLLTTDILSHFIKGAIG